MYSTRIMRIIVVMAVLSGVLWSAEQAQSEATQWPGPPKTQAPQDKPKTETRPAAKHDKIHPDVLSKLEKSEDGKVYVLVTLKPLPKEGLSKEQRKAMAKEKQNKLLAKLAEGDFTADYRFEIEPRIIGLVNETGLAKIAEDPQVVAVESSRIGPGVIRALGQAADGKVFVMILLTTLPGTDDRPLDDVKAMIQQHQEKVLDSLTQEDFEIAHRLSVTEVLMGYLKPSGIPKMATDPTIRGVVLNKWYKGPQTTPPKRKETGEVSQQAPRRTIALASSIQFLDADDVHRLGYEGE